MGMLKEFKEFAMRGNVIDLAVGVIIGGAFGKIISSFVDDVITPLLLNPVLKAANLERIDQLVIFDTVKYGVFLSATINFILVAIVLFLLIKGINSTKKKEEAAPEAPPAPTKEEVLLAEIRDLLKNK
ncbi:MAG TPA: large-conductance mechanosensitive channel protein MscL [Chitinophagales bacterium]|nr:large-conductance mechanosensitive channel protein MscL [Chitinophagales bacterium]